MIAYYNEIDPYAAAWLRNLIAAGHLPVGDVDERNIKDVQASDIKGYTNCHFFAGIGGWPHALRLAGWPDDRPVWTGSCPCQPFSVAGKGQAQKDERHLWPAWFKLISAVHPPIIFGEQVAGAIAHGWLDDAFDDLEGQGYETGGAVLPACSVGAPHKRDRLWFMAHTPLCGWRQRNPNNRRPHQESSEIQKRNRFANGGETMADANNARSQGWLSTELPECSSEQPVGASGASLADTDFKPQGRASKPWSECNFWQSEPAVGRVANGIPARVGKLRAFGNAIVPQVAAEFIRAAMQII